MAGFKVITEVERIEFDRGVTPFDLTLDLEPGDQGLHGILYFNTDLFEYSTIERLAQHFVTLLEHAIQSPGEKLSQLRLMTAEEQARVLAWGQNAKPYPSECVHALFEKQVAETPDAAAVVFENTSLSYAELNRRANRLAHRLMRLGIEPQEKVGIVIERSPEFIAGILGILKAGAAYVPIDPEYPRERRDFMMRDCGIRFLLVLPSAEPIVTECAVKFIDVRFDSSDDGGPDTGNPVCITSPDCPAYVMYTSDSTGRPKGVEIPHRGIVRLVVGSEYAEMNEMQVFLQLAPVSFDASTFEIWGALLHGAQLVIFTGSFVSVDEIESALSRHGSPHYG